MGRHQRAETSGLISFILCLMVAAVSMTLYMDNAPAIWLVTRRVFIVGSAAVAICGVLSFIVGYSRRSRSLSGGNGWWVPIRRVFEIIALSVVYAATIFLSIYAILAIMNDMMGVRIFSGYIPWVCGIFAGIAGYITFVQADLMDAKTIASLLPLFVMAGVSTAGLTTDDPYWWHNNFSQLGDRTTFAARMFNSTLILAGVCIIIISYFAISELRATHRMRLAWSASHRPAPKVDDLPQASGEVHHFRLRTTLLSVLLVCSGIAFIGIGSFRYSPHPILHNVFARGLPGLMCILLIGLPWLAPQLSKAMYVISDLAIALCAAAGVIWLEGANTLTNVEALAGLMFLGWFIVFSRQIAAIEADRVQAQLVFIQSASGHVDGDDPVMVESRLSADQ
ncbi:MAG: ABC transporter permease [Bifidobacterium crudilactis]|uniref:ABC transporter permease n=1 Tax=Bifidobacterium crudilactis TaxID=327277 RepID=UPI003F986B09